MSREFTITTSSEPRDFTIVQGGDTRTFTINNGVGPKGDAGAAGTNGGSTSAWNYKAKTNATSGYPGNGYLLWNNATQTSATSIIVSHLNDDDTDLELLLGFLVSGQKIFIQDRDESANNQVWTISGAPTLTGAGTSTAYYTFPVTLVSSAGTAFTNNHQLIFGAISAAGGNSVTSATTSDGTADLDLDSFTVESSATFNATTYTFGTGAASAMKSALAIASADITDASGGGDADKLLKLDSSGGISFTVEGISIEVFGENGKITTSGNGGRIETGGDNAEISTNGLNSHILTSGGGYIETSSTFNIASGTFPNIVKTTLSGTQTSNRAIAFPDVSGTVALTSDITGTNSGTNTGDQTSIVGITGTTAQFNTALTDGDFATLAGSENLTNKTLTSPTINTSATFNATSYTYGSGAAAAHRTALGVANVSTKTRTADAAAVTSTTFAADASLTTPLEANTTYKIDFFLHTTQTGFSAIRYDYTGTFDS